MLGAAFNSSMFNSNQPRPSNGLPPTISANQLKSVAPDIRAPNEVKNILDRIHSLQPSKPSNTDTQEDSSTNNDRLVSETTLSDKKKGRKPKKSNISIF
jgi:hypothetical protein